MTITDYISAVVIALSLTLGVVTAGLHYSGRQAFALLVFFVFVTVCWLATFEAPSCGERHGGFCGHPASQLCRDEVGKR